MGGGTGLPEEEGGRGEQGRARLEGAGEQGEPGWPGQTAHLPRSRQGEDTDTRCKIRAVIEPMPQKGDDYEPAKEQNHPKCEGGSRNVT